MSELTGEKNRKIQRQEKKLKKSEKWFNFFIKKQMKRFRYLVIFEIIKFNFYEPC